MADPMDDIKHLDDAIKRLTELVDLKVMPTLLVLAGVTQPASLPGGSGGSSSGGSGGGVSFVFNVAFSRLISLAEISNDLQRATHAIMMGTATPPPSGPTPTPPPIPGGKPPAGTGGGRIGRAYRSIRAGISRGASAGRKLGAGASKLAGGAGAGGRMAAAGGVAGGAIGGVVAIGAAAYAAGKAIIGWTDAAMASAAKLAEVSGSMAQVMAEREVKNIQRDQQRGEATAGSTRTLMEAEDRRKNAMLPLENAIDNATNMLLAAGNDLITPILGKLNDGVELLKSVPGIGKLIDAATKSKPSGEGGPLNREMADMMRRLGMEDAEHRRMLDDAARAAAARMGGVAAPDGALRAGDGLGAGVRIPPL